MIWLDIFLLVLVGLMAGFVKGTSGFGSSLVAIPLLFRLGFSGTEVVTMMITCNIALNLLLVNEHKSYFKIETLQTIAPIIVFGILFTIVGLYLNDLFSDRTIELIASGLIIIAILVKLEVFHFSIKDKFHNLMIVGMLSGLGNGIASIDGPPVVLYLSSVKATKVRFKSTLSIHFLIMGIAGVLILFLKGNFNVDVLVSIGYLFVSLVVGLFVGMRFSRNIDEKQFTKIVLVILVGLAVSLLIP